LLGWDGMIRVDSNRNDDRQVLEQFKYELIIVEAVPKYVLKLLEAHFLTLISARR